jgi:hypothetical protein
VSKRGGRVPAPPVGDEWDLRFAAKAAADAWDKLCNVAATNCARLHGELRADPRHAKNPSRHHQLKGELSTGNHGGRILEQWQYEVTGAGRVWFLIDDDNRRVLFTKVSLGHPSGTE